VGVEELRDSVNGIRMKEDMRRAVIENVTRRTQQPDGRQTEQEGSGKIMQNRKKSRIMKNLAAAALVVAVIGVAAVPVRALVNSLVKERMEEMPQEEKETYVETLKEQEVEADGYTRAYTESEKERYQELASQYQAGTFPREAVTQVESEEEAASYELCFLKPTSTFCLPDRELTDEELLQIIDFITKRDYAFEEDYAREHAEEIAAQEEQEKAEIARNVESGGITEQQAIEIATRKLYEIFGVTEDGFERNSYYDEPDEMRGLREAVYCVNWSNIITHQYYYFYIDAQDGQMTWAAHSGEFIHAQSVELEEAKSRIPALQAQATECMERTVGETYDKVYVYYLSYPDGSAGLSVGFFFAREDQSAWSITYTWDGLMYEIEENGISGLEDGMEREMWNGEESIKTNVVFQELEQ
jgi:hypothetical protein